MKIVIDARMYGLENTGIGRYVTNLVNELAKIDESNNYAILLRKKYFAKLKFPKNFKKVEAELRHYSLAEQVKLLKLINAENPDITHFPHFNVPLAYRGKFVVTIHDLLMHKQKGRKATTLPYPIYLVKRVAYKTVFHKAVMGSEKIIVPSDVTKAELLDLYKINSNKVVRIYEGVNFNSSKKGENTIEKKFGLTKPYFIYTGNAYPHKNLERAISTFVKLNTRKKRGKHSQVMFAIVSARGVFTKKLERLVAKYNAKGYVKLLGYVPDGQLSALYKNAEAFFYPSLTEGFGLPGLEAMSSGTLALVSEIPIFREVYGNSAMYFDPLDEESMASKIEKVLSMDKVERERLLKKGYFKTKEYSWESMAKGTLKVYEQASK